MSKDLNNGVYLAIRGGGVKTASSLGIIKYLEENNIPIKGVAGTSIGSFIAVCIASGLNAEQIFLLFYKYYEYIVKASRLHHGEGSFIFEDSINKELKNIKFKDLKIPCFINALDINPLRYPNYVFSRKTTPELTVGEAVRASSSYPILYGPYFKKINGHRHLFYDGGLICNPLIVTNKYTTLYSGFSMDSEKRSIFRGIPLKSEAKADIVIEPNLGPMGTLGSTDDIKTAYQKGYEEAKRVLSKKL